LTSVRVLHSISGSVCSSFSKVSIVSVSSASFNGRAASARKQKAHPYLILVPMLFKLCGDSERLPFASLFINSYNSLQVHPTIYKQHG